MAQSSNQHDRPVIFDYRAIPLYVTAMLGWRRETDASFSIRSATRGLRRCSPSLVTRVMSGERRLTSDRVDGFAKLLQLTPEEKSALSRWVSTEELSKQGNQELPVAPRMNARKTGQNHLLSDWLNIYVKDSCRLKGFEPDPLVLFKLLRGIASPARIERSLRFLLREGFLRRTLDGKIVEDNPVTMTSDDIPSSKIKQFHSKALEMARRGIYLYPIEKRRELALVLRLNAKSLAALRDMLKQFHEQLLVFAEEHVDDQDELFQVTINLVPIGGLPHDKTNA